MGLTTLETKFITLGYDKFTVDEKNIFIQFLARRAAKPLTDITEESILVYHKEIKVYLVNQKCEDDIINGFTSTNGHVYRTNRDDQINMIGQKDELMDDPSIATVPWKTQDAGYVVHTREEWLTQVYVEAFQNKKIKLFKYNSIKEKIIAATTHDEIIALTW
jgi:hypothetical protein